MSFLSALSFFFSPRVPCLTFPISHFNNYHGMMFNPALQESSGLNPDLIVALTRLFSSLFDIFLSLAFSHLFRPFWVLKIFTIIEKMIRDKFMT